MSVSEDLARISITATGGQTVFNFTNIKVMTVDDIRVWQNGTELVGSFTVTLNSVTLPSDGFVTLGTGATASDIIIIERNVPRTQPTVYNPGTAFPAKSHENALDRLTLLVQDGLNKARRSPQFDNEGKDANLDWVYIDLPDAVTPKVPIADPATKIISWGDISTPAALDFSALTGTLAIDGTDARVLDYDAPFAGSVDRDLTARAGDFFSVKDFGAVGDGATDDSAAITSTVTAAGSQGIVVFPSGTYRITSSITVRNILATGGATLDTTGGNTLTVEGTIYVGRENLFTNTGTVTISDHRPVLPEWFGAVPGSGLGLIGDADATAALNNAVAACSDGNGWVSLGAGSYRVATTWTVDKGGMRITGMGQTSTFLRGSSTTAFVMNIDTPDSVIVEDMRITPFVTKTAGGAINVTDTTPGSNAFSRFNRLHLDSDWVHLSFENARGFTVSNCRITSPKSISIVVRNNNLPDGGDSTIYGCIIEHTTQTETAILQGSSGGLRLHNNKFLAHATQLQIQMDDTVNTSILNVTGNSFENATRSILITKVAATTGSFKAIQIAGNHFNAHATSAIEVTNTVASTFHGLTVNGNYFDVPNLGTAILLSGQADFTIVGNTFVQTAGSGTAINASGNASNGTADANTYSGSITPFTTASQTVLHHPRYLYSTTVFDPPLIGAGLSSATSVAVTGAAVDMPVIATHSGIGGLDMIVTAVVQAAGTVRVIFHNPSGIGVDVPSGNLNLILVDAFDYGA